MVRDNGAVLPPATAVRAVRARPAARRGHRPRAPRQPVPSGEPRPSPPRARADGGGLPAGHGRPREPPAARRPGPRAGPGLKRCPERPLQRRFQTRDSVFGSLLDREASTSTPTGERQPGDPVGPERQLRRARGMPDRDWLRDGGSSFTGLAGSPAEKAVASVAADWRWQVSHAGWNRPAAPPLAPPITLTPRRAGRTRWAGTRSFREDIPARWPGLRSRRRDTARFQPQAGGSV